MFWFDDAGHMGAGGVVMVLFWLLVLVGVVLVVRYLMANGAEGPPSTQSPLDILKARYARGEISRDEFEQMRKDLDS